MKKAKIIFGLILILALIVSANYAQEITLTTTAKNLVASKATIEMPALSGNQDAIIIATPLGDTARLNPHPIGAWYYNGKWNIFNTDHATMPVGAKFKVQVFLKPDANHFLHTITKENLIADGSYLDNPALNNNPNAQVTIFQNHAPDYRASPLNKFEAKAEYDPNLVKWCIKNVNGESLSPNTAYNVIITTTGTVTPTSTTSMPIATPYVPIISTLAPLTLTVVVKTEWTVPPQGGLAHSSGLCKIVNGTYNNPNILATDNVIVTGQAELEGAYLKWTATVENGAIHFNVCNWKQMTLNTQAALYLNGRKINILVLR